MTLNRSSTRPIMLIAALMLLAAMAVLVVSCRDNAGQATGGTEITGATEDIKAIAEARGLTPADVANRTGTLARPLPLMSTTVVPLVATPRVRQTRMGVYEESTTPRAARPAGVHRAALFTS